VAAGVVEAKGDQVSHALPAHVGEIHRRAGSWLRWAMGCSAEMDRRSAQGATKSDRLMATDVIGTAAAAQRSLGIGTSSSHRVEPA
jgi:hypothetical protein